MVKRILIVENKLIDSQRARRVIESELHEFCLEFFQATSEVESLERCDEWSSILLDIVIMDQALTYSNDEGQCGSSDVNLLKAGTRCYDQLRKNPRAAAVPVIFYTLLDQRSVPDDVFYVYKRRHPDEPELAKMVGSIIRRSPSVIQ